MYYLKGILSVFVFLNLKPFGIADLYPPLEDYRIYGVRSRTA